MTMMEVPRAWETKTDQEEEFLFLERHSMMGENWSLIRLLISFYISCKQVQVTLCIVCVRVCVCVCVCVCYCRHRSVQEGLWSCAAGVIRWCHLVKRLLWLRCQLIWLLSVLSMASWSSHDRLLSKTLKSQFRNLNVTHCRILYYWFISLRICIYNTFHSNSFCLRAGGWGGWGGLLFLAVLPFGIWVACMSLVHETTLCIQMR